MAALDDLLARIEDKALRADIERELEPLRGEQQLGLVFERHLPEKVRLYDLQVRRGATVEVRADLNSPTWQVEKITDQSAHLQRRERNAVLREIRSLDDLVVVREFGDPIYPGLNQVGEVKRGGDKPSHVVINSENFHALEALLYTCEGEVDVIYIDPPYNSGARDWKYNNDYVDGQDRYRHSKWLSFMEKRLQIAKRLLNPDNSALIVTIDEKEYLRLGILLEQVFPSGQIQMVSSVINPRGIVRANEFSRVNEFIYFVWFGSATIAPVAGEETIGNPVAWETMRRRSLAGARGKTGPGACGPNQFFPIYVDEESGYIVGRGDALPLHAKVSRHKPPPGCVAVFPARDDGTEMNWSLTTSAFDDRFPKGYVRAGKATPDKPQKYLIQYILGGVIDDIDAGILQVVGKREDGSVEAYYLKEKSKMPLSQWDIPSHNAQQHGTGLLNKMLAGRKFPYAKSLYAVEDTLRFFVKDNPTALIVDFFAGSGTTTHAVMRLNKQDGGMRTSIVVTNNEVGPDAERRFAQLGQMPGDPAWESAGIFEHITRPRIEAAVTGLAPDGKPMKGDYRFADEFPMKDGFEENVEFFKLTYEDPDLVQLGVAFEAVAPLLWLRAGAQGPKIREVSDDGWSVPEGGRYGVLFDVNHWPAFTRAVRGSDMVSHAFVVTDSDAVFQQVVADLPDEVESVRLYESYLTSFAINTKVTQ